MKKIMKIVLLYAMICVLLGMIVVCVFGCKKADPVGPIQKNEPPKTDLKFLVLFSCTAEPIPDGYRVVEDSVYMYMLLPGERHFWPMKNGEVKVFSGEEAKLMEGHEVVAIWSYYVADPNDNCVPMTYDPYPQKTISALLPAPDTNIIKIHSYFFDVHQRLMPSSSKGLF